MEEFAKRFVELRKERNMSQVKISEALGVSKSSVAMWETGSRLPSPEVLEQIADYFNVDIDYLYGRSNIRRKVMYDETGAEYVSNEKSSPYYLDDEAREMAEFMFQNPEYRVLFDASRKISKEDIETVKAILDKFKRPED